MGRRGGRARPGAGAPDLLDHCDLTPRGCLPAVARELRTAACHQRGTQSSILRERTHAARERRRIVRIGRKAAAVFTTMAASIRSSGRTNLIRLVLR